VKNSPKFYSFCLFGTTLLNLISPSIAATEVKTAKTQAISDLAAIEVHETESKLANTIESAFTPNPSDSPNLFLEQNSFSFNTSTPTSKTLIAQVPANPDGSNSNTPTYPTNYNPSYNPVTPTPTNLSPLNPNPVIPAPTININGSYVPASGIVPPTAPPPPYLPRAVPPPVGDISISNIDASTGNIDLGSGGSQRITGLVLKDAPAREVLEVLARSAGLNLAFYSGNITDQPGQPGATSSTGGPLVSLNIQDESAQDVFNYVLMLSGLQANRIGRTIFVGAQLPPGARQLISRTLRMNQVSVGQAVGFLIAQGAEQQQVATQTQVTIVGEGPGAQRITNTSTSVSRIAAQPEIPIPGQNIGPSAALLLRGVLVTADERLNAITLIGEPRKIEIASALLTQLDLRRRQVAINVKIVDVNLLKTDDFSTSFSFGVGDAFFNIDAGAAVFNYGGINPPSANSTFGGVVAPGVVANPYANANIFFDPNSSVSIPGTSPGSVVITPTGVSRIGDRGAASFYTPFVTLDNPLQPGFSNITPATDNITTIDSDGNASTSAGTLGTVTSALPSLFQYPTRFLSKLRAQITSGNAKILTDPTMVVQEGERTKVNLTQEVLGGFQTDFVQVGNVVQPQRRPIIKEAGLILDIQVPRIDDNGFVTLAVAPTVSAVGSQVNTDDGIIALLQKREMQSGQIRLRDGQTLILSGIIQESDRTTVSKVPILGDLPILGALFRSTNRQNQRQEVIVLLTPQIIDDTSGKGSFGYGYTPGNDTRQILQRQGFPVPNR
jgi:type IV pilus assembly protein PilQ